MQVLKRTLGLCAPEFVGRNIYFAEAIGFLANVRHLVSPSDGRPAKRRVHVRIALLIDYCCQPPPSAL